MLPMTPSKGSQAVAGPTTPVSPAIISAALATGVSPERMAAAAQAAAALGFPFIPFFPPPPGLPGQQQAPVGMIRKYRSTPPAIRPKPPTTPLINGSGSPLSPGKDAPPPSWIQVESTDSHSKRRATSSATDEPIAVPTGGPLSPSTPPSSAVSSSTAKGKSLSSAVLPSPLPSVSTPVKGHTTSITLDSTTANILADVKFPVSPAVEDTASKRVRRMIRNREAARECRRKRKEYVSDLETRIRVVERQNRIYSAELSVLKKIVSMSNPNALTEASNAGLTAGATFDLEIDIPMGGGGSGGGADQSSDEN